MYKRVCAHSFKGMSPFACVPVTIEIEKKKNSDEGSVL